MKKEKEKRPMRLLLLEDDMIESNKFTALARTRKDIEFVAMTNSAETGIEYLKHTLPEGVILDLQLVAGEGSGLRFMEILNEDMTLPIVPLVVVTTSNKSKSVNQRLEDLGVDWYFSKSSDEYCPELVIDTLLSLRSTLAAKQRTHVELEDLDLFVSRNRVEAPHERENRYLKRIDSELNVIGVRAKLKGRAYLREAILCVLMKKTRTCAVEEVARRYKLTYSSTLKSMQVAIHDAWATNDPEIIVKCYTAPIRTSTGVPHVSDFVHYFATKIETCV